MSHLVGIFLLYISQNHDVKIQKSDYHDTSSAATAILIFVFTALTVLKS